MGAFEHARWKIFNPAQHPLMHDISAFGYVNPRLPTLTSLAEAIDYIVASIYPNYQATVANKAALPAAGNPNDYYIVSDDGDGKAAGYIWSTIDNVGQWVKRYDLDWSMENILTEAVNRTHYMYVHKYGMQDRDADGNPLAGVLAGQHIYGSDTADEHLTLHANSGDVGGAHTGYVQVDDHFRPTADTVYDLGTAIEGFRDAYISRAAYIDTMGLSTGQIIDTTGAISFGDENLSTTGTLASGNHTIGTLTLAAASITDSSGAISFGDEDLSTTGDITGGSLVTGTLTLAGGSITDSSGQVSFGDENLLTTGTITGGQVNADNLRLDGNTLSATNVGGNLLLVANGAGVVDVQSAMTTLGQSVTGTLGVTGQLNIDNLRLDGNVIGTTDLNGDLTFTPNGSGRVLTSAHFLPGGDGTLDLGATASRFRTAYLGTGLSDGTNSIAIATLLAFREALTGVAEGDALFWDGAKFVASNPDTEVDHSIISNLTTGDAGHTQFAMLAGRAGGQTLQGGTAASENLTLDSTAHGTKGAILLGSNLTPVTTAAYSGGWSGTDLGDSTHVFRDLYMTGEAKGFRFESYTTVGRPGNSGSKIGRAIYDTDLGKVLIDSGAAWVELGGGGAGTPGGADTQVQFNDGGAFAGAAQFTFSKTTGELKLNGVGASAGTSLYIGTSSGATSPASANQGASNTIIGHAAGSGATGTTFADNTIIGYWAGLAQTTGNKNVFIGSWANKATTNTAITDAVAIGYSATARENGAIAIGSSANAAGAGAVSVGQSAGANLTGAGNTLVGYQAGAGTGTANSNAAVGYRAMYRVTNGTKNSVFGYMAANALTSGSNNTALGYTALGAITTVSDGTAVGYQALNAATGANNTAVGSNAGLAVTTGNANVFVGQGADTTRAALAGAVIVGQGAKANADYAIAIGQEATAVSTGAIIIGYAAGKNSGAGNTIIGYAAAGGTGTGNNNTAIGVFALGSNTNGAANVAVGYQAGSGVNTGSYITAVGYQAVDGANAGYSAGFGYKALSGTTGTGNTGIGAQAGDTVGSGTNNCFFGYLADTTLATVQDAVAIGYNAKANANGAIAIGSGVTSGTANLAVIGTTSHTVSIPGNLKTTILSSSETVNALGNVAAGTVTMDLALGNVHTMTLTGNVALAFSNIATSGKAHSVTIFLKQDPTGSRTVTAWPGTTLWAGGSAPTLTTTASKTDIVTLVTVDAGVTWYGFVGGLNF